MEEKLFNQIEKSLAQRDQQVIWHPFTQMQTAKDPIAIQSAKGVYLYPVNGPPLIDAISSWWVNLHGHTHPHLVKKICRQAKQLEHVIFAGFTHLPAVELAEKLTQLFANQMAKVFYSDNGSTAVEVAIKMALQFFYNQNPSTRKKEIICFRSSYHGDTFGAMSVSARSLFNQPFWSHLFKVHLIDAPLKGQEDKSLKQLKKIIASQTTACFIFEPLILGTGGMQIYSADGLNQLIHLCHKHQVLTIADEVMTGFGRTGTLFACHQLTEKPNIVCLSKGLTGGFLPLGVTMCQQFIYDQFLSSSVLQAFLHGHSYTANPLACASALASLDLVLSQKSKQQRLLISHAHERFCSKWKNHPKLKRCESLGTILAVEFVSNSDSSYDHPLREKLMKFFLDKGILIRPLGSTLYLMPPYCMTKKQLNYLYKQIIASLDIIK